MNVTKTSVRHELIILVMYWLMSPVLFGMYYPETISGDAGLIYVFILMIAGATCILSFSLITTLKFLVKLLWTELCYVIIPLFISTFISIYSFDNTYEPIKITFYISNSILLAFIYALSICYKITVHKN